MKRDAILYFLKEIDRDFEPPLSAKIEIESYVDKILAHAELVMMKNSENEVIGLVVLYCNDKITYRAYISLVGVKRSFRGLGKAQEMVKQAIHIARAKGMRVVGIHSNNPIAISLYEKLGFKTIVSEERKYLEKIL